MKLFLGVDGGQSSTTALIADEGGSVLGYGRSGPCNHVKGPQGREKFIRAIEGSLAQACSSAGLNPEDVAFSAACLGFSGGPEDKQALLDSMLRCERMVVTNDAIIALAGAAAGAPAIITIAGTGSIAYGRNAESKFARAGGWGFIYGDEGGGFDLTRQALRAALRYEEGWGQATSLHAILLRATSSQNANEMLHRFYTSEYTRPYVASLSVLVDEAAADGDAVAHSLLMNSAQQLATYASSVRAQLFQSGDPVAVAYIGGVFRSAPLLERFRMLVELEEGNRVRPPRYGPAAGALVEAYRAAGMRCELSNLPEMEK